MNTTRAHYPGNDPENGPAHLPTEFQCASCRDTGLTPTGLCDCGCNAEHPTGCPCRVCENDRRWEAILDGR